MPTSLTPLQLGVSSLKREISAREASYQMNETVRLAEFAAELQYEDLPPAVVQALKVYILDNLAAGLVGSGTPWAQIVMGLARKSAPTGAC